MREIAIVEDEDESATLLSRHLERYEKDSGERFNISRFKNAVAFLTGYKMQYDVVFMDIDMPYMNGMTASHKLRELDPDVALVFVTNLAQLAVQGYSVSAFDFIVKPVAYGDFAMKMKRIVKSLKKSETVCTVIRTDNTMVKLPVESIIYVEVLDHKLVYHTAEKAYPAYGSMKKVESEEGFENFARCNSCYLVNLAFVEKVKGYTVTVGGRELVVSHPKKSEFVRALNEYLGTRA